MMMLSVNGNALWSITFAQVRAYTDRPATARSWRLSIWLIYLTPAHLSLCQETERHDCTITDAQCSNLSNRKPYACSLSAVLALTTVAWITFYLGSPAKGSADGR